MKTNVFLFFCLIISGACSFKPPEEKNKKEGERQYEQLKAQDLEKMDTDGDQLNDLMEKERGLNPFVADIPELSIRFLQNYSIKVNWHVKDANGVHHPDSFWDFTIDTRVGRNDPDFNYRVGEILVRNKAFQEAARIGRFSTHSWGEIKESDLTRVTYPDVDARFTGNNNLRNGQYFNNPHVVIDKISVELENSVKLKANSVYSSIKNLELNFYYFDYETESYELLATKVIDRHFNRDVTETFSVVLENVPLNLVADNYLKRGEFIISEVRDFEIPEGGFKYTELMKSVKEKTIQIVLNTPLETSYKFVSPFQNKNRFNQLLEITHPNQFKIEENEVTKLGQFVNNLPDFTHLKEVKEEDKKGKWFVHTNRLTKNYLDHEFQEGEAIILSYLTGKDLSEQQSEKVSSLRFSISGNEDYEIYPMGNISPNSVVNFQLSTGKLMGEEVIQTEDRPYSGGGSCGKNCTTWHYQCHFKFNKFQNRNSGFEFKKDFSEELSQLAVLVNEEEFSLKKLVEEKKVEVFWKDQNVHFRIPDISKIKEISEANENVIALKITTFTDTTFDGVYLLEHSGRENYGCFQLAAIAAYNLNIPLYEGSKDFNQWRHLFRWDVIKLGKDRSYKQPFSLNLSSSVNNFYN